MNRRSFFNFLGSAVIGIVITLKLPDSIAPIKIDVEKCNNGMEAIFKLIDDDLNAAMKTIYSNFLKRGRSLTADEILEAYSKP